VGAGLIVRVGSAARAIVTVAGGVGGTTCWAAQAASTRVRLRKTKPVFIIILFLHNHYIDKTDDFL
jgi:hypothetical protein